MARSIRVRKSSPFFALASAVIIVASLYLAREVLIPLVLALLLSFLLAPAVRSLERLKFPRIPAVLVVVVFAIGLVFGLGWIVAEQVGSLAENIPQYQDEIVKKMRHLRASRGGISDNIERLGEEIEKATVDPDDPSSSSQPGAQPESAPADAEPPLLPPAVAPEPTGTAMAAPPSPASAPAGTTPENPVYIAPVESPRLPLKTLHEALGLVANPLATAAMVIVFLVFMLIERRDMRDRIIRLVSAGNYTVTTRAFDDAATRISRYMRAQSIVNGTYGLVIVLGLWLIGRWLGNGTAFPNFVLWGLLCALLRFVPYVGPWVAAAFPIALSLAVYPGFGVFAATASMFMVLEILSNNFMEPWLYGSSTGISSVAILVAAVFWTWLWGPLGLLLSTPLTVCIVVLGKYVPSLRFLDVLLGDQPALEPPVRYYQRLLAGDRAEAAAIAKEYALAQGAVAAADDVLIPALILARRDRENAGLSPEDETVILEATQENLDHLEEPPAKTGAEDSAKEAVAEAEVPSLAEAMVLGCPAHHRVEELVLHMLARSMKPEGFNIQVVSTRTLPVEIEAQVDRETPALVFIAVLPPGGLEQARYLCRRLRKRSADLKIIVGYWGRSRNFDRLLVRLRTAGANYVATSLAQSRTQIRAALAPAGESPPRSPPEVTGPPVAAVCAS